MSTFTRTTRGRPVLKVGHSQPSTFQDEAKLLELQDHIAAYLAQDDGELDPGCGGLPGGGANGGGQPTGLNLAMVEA